MTKNWWQRDPFRTLRREIGKTKVLTQPEELYLYGFDATEERALPSAVVFPETTADVQAVVRFAHAEATTITPRGAGTGLSGGSVPVAGGIVLSTERMTQIKRMDPEKRVAIVQPGVVTAIIQEEANKHGLFYPPDPSSYTVSTIGGNIAENAGGLRCFKYGVTSHYVLGLEFVDAQGNIRKTGALDERDTEPDLTALLTGSEGTLGIITHAALRLIEAPETTVTISAFVSEAETAFALIEGIVQRGWVPSVLEYIDNVSLEASANHIGIEYPEDAKAMLLIELDGSRDHVDGLLPHIIALLEEEALQVEVATTSVARESLWQLRRGISPSLIRHAANSIHEDVAVPRGSLYKLVHKVHSLSGEYNLRIAVYGHAGDGNLHVVIMYDGKSNTEKVKANEVAKEIFKSAIEMGGTITGEHGVGHAKRAYLSWQISPQAIKLMKGIKKKLDPDGIFNPGKVLE